MQPAARRKNARPLFCARCCCCCNSRLWGRLNVMKWEGRRHLAEVKGRTIHNGGGSCAAEECDQMEIVTIPLLHKSDLCPCKENVIIFHCTRLLTHAPATPTPRQTATARESVHIILSNHNFGGANTHYIAAANGHHSACYLFARRAPRCCPVFHVGGMSYCPNISLRGP